uniref:Uncharacterized protein n=1 Tax=Cacopsylla melanoneura TaxID=428564 RepID=A0A8D8QIK2_9HEMI
MYFLFLFSLSLFLLFLHCFYLFAPLTICLSFNLSFLSIFSTLPHVEGRDTSSPISFFQPNWGHSISQSMDWHPFLPHNLYLFHLECSPSASISFSNFMSPRLGLYFFKHGYFTVYGTLSLP